MTDSYKQLKEELSVYYPDFTDDELTKMTDNLINFFALSVKACKTVNSLSDIDGSYSENQEKPTSAKIYKS